MAIPAATAAFNFPPSIDPELEQVTSPQQLKDVLRVISAEEQVPGNCARFKIFTQKNRYLYANCLHKKCKAGLRYKLDGSVFRLAKSNLQHQHDVGRMKHYKFRGIVNYLKDLPPTIAANSLKKIICPQFSINEKQFYYLYQKSRFSPLSFLDLVKQLEDQGYEVFSTPTNSIHPNPPEILIVTNTTMRSNFQRYGDVSTFDLTFNLIKNVHQSNKKWKVGCFLGESSAKHIVPFALVVTLFETKESYVRILRTYFELMKGQPNVLVTDEEAALQSAVAQLKASREYKGLHLLDVFHILKNIRKNLRVKQHLYLFKAMIHARNECDFRKATREAEQKLHAEQKHLLRRFMQNSDRYCFSKISPVFFGFTASTPNQRFHNLLKSTQSSEKEYSLTVRNTLNFLKVLGSRAEEFVLEKNPYEDIFALPELKILRYVLSKPIFSRFADELAKSIGCEVIESNSERIYLKQGGVFFQLTKENTNSFKCSCLYQEKAALPCRHLLRYFCLKHQPIMDHIPTRWKCNSENGSKPAALRTIPLGRERLSRRNRS